MEVIISNMEPRPLELFYAVRLEKLISREKEDLEGLVILYRSSATQPPANNGKMLANVFCEEYEGERYVSGVAYTPPVDLFFSGESIYRVHKLTDEEKKEFETELTKLYEEGRFIGTK